MADVLCTQWRNIEHRVNLKKINNIQIVLKGNIKGANK